MFHSSEKVAGRFRVRYVKAQQQQRRESREREEKKLHHFPPLQIDTSLNLPGELMGHDGAFHEGRHTHTLYLVQQPAGKLFTFR